MAIVTKLHPTLKVEKSLKRNTQPSYNMQYKGYFSYLKKFSHFGEIQTFP